jgi:tetratricopeptide (TPR) repeat protein
MIEAELASQIAGLVVPFLPKLIDKAAETAAGKAGETAWNKALSIWNKLWPEAEKDPEVAKAIKDVAQNAEDPDAKGALAWQLKKLTLPAEVLYELQKIIAEINSGIHITSADHGSVAVGGSVTGSTIIGGINVHSELDKVDNRTKNNLINAHAQHVINSPENAKYYLALGLDYMDKGMYKFAIDSLLKAHERAPLDTTVLFYLSLANIGGEKPRTLTLSKVREIESYLNDAIKLDRSKAHLLYLLALVKYDFYFGKGYDINPPYPDDIMEAAEQATYTHSEINQIIKHVQVPSALSTILLSKW